jgi:hypothetical protein
LILKGNGLANREAGAALGSVLKTCTSLTALDVSENGYYECDGPGFASEFVSGLKDAKGSLSKLTFCGNGGRGGGEGDPVTIDPTMTEADFSGMKLGAAGAQILAAFMSTKMFEAKGSLSKFTFSGDDHESRPLTVEIGMTEADFSGADLGPTGAVILAVWLKHKVQHTAHYVSDLLRFAI